MVELERLRKEKDRAYEEYDKRKHTPEGDDYWQKYLSAKRAWAVAADRADRLKDGYWG